MTRSRWLALVGLGLAVGLATAEPQPTPAGKDTGLIPRKVLFGNPDRAGVQISPDGKRLAFLAPVDGVLNVWVGPADRPEEARPVTRDKKRGIRRYFWAFTNDHIVYVQDTDGDEDFHVYLVDLGKNETKDLTPLKKITAQITSVNHRFPGEILVGINDRTPQLHDLHRIDLKTGERKLVQKNDGFLSFLVDNDGKVRFAIKFNPKGGTVTMQPDGKGGWKEFLEVGMEDALTTSVAGFDKNNKVAYFVDSRGRDTAALTTLDLESGKQEVLAVDPRSDVGSVLSHPTEQTIQAVAFDYDRRRWEFKDPAVKKDFEVLRKVADGEINVGSRTLDDRTWVVAFTMDNGPVRYYLYHRDTQKARFLFTNRKDLEGWPLQKMHPRVLDSRDGLKLVCYLTLPPDTDPDSNGVPTRPVPMVLLVHGGPWGRDSFGYHPQHQLLANRGYAVLSVNFRASTGFGKKFLNAGNREWAGKMHDDLIDAVDWAIKEKIAVPDKVAIMGGSYGGYATLVGLTFTPEKFACGVDIVGPSSIVTLLKTIPPYWAPALDLFKSRVGDHTTEEGRTFLESRSPLTKVAQIRRPLLIGQGANDPRVKQSESDQIVKAMQERKIPVTYVLFPDEGHGFARPENDMAFYAVTEAFLARHLGGRFEAIGAAFKGSTIKVPVGADDVPGLAAKLSKKDE